ncbi:class I SAM-dependent methyltransferase [Candidatus Parcubacteria bacterium]|nr:class I SAM-dependent methyltransferase [Candidatus Parcubacteria bacterium]
MDNSGQKGIRRDVVRLVKCLNLSRDEIIIDLWAGDGSQINMLRLLGYRLAFGVDLKEAPPFVQCGDMRKYVQQNFNQPVGMIFCRYALHFLCIDDTGEMFNNIFRILRRGAYFYLVTFSNNDHVVSGGYSMCELADLAPSGLRIIKSKEEKQKDEEPYNHEHQIVKMLFRKE